MSRPQPTLIASHQEGDTVVEVCEATAVYAVLFQGRPIKLRTHKPELRYQGYKYSKASFPEPGHAIRLARRLNLAYCTDEFTVSAMTLGREISLSEHKPGENA
jgi:hypothetical protein